MLIEKQVNNIIELKEKNNNANITDSLSAINEEVYKIFHFTEEEILFLNSNKKENNS